MPELPEVETIRLDLEKRILNTEIIQVGVVLPKIVHNPLSFFRKKLIGAKFVKTDRKGKLLILEINNDLFLTIHLRMTGQLIYKHGQEVVAGGHSEKTNDFNLPSKHSHVILNFKDGGQLFYNDLRQFGYLEIVDKERLKQIKSKFGYEPFGNDFTLETLEGLSRGRKRNVKAFLLDQSLVTGLGNIYVDEVLFASEVSPLRIVGDLNNKEVELIYKNIKEILKNAIDNRGTTFNNYVDANGKKGNFTKLLKVYGRGGEKCLICGDVLKKMKVAGRGTVYCERCQK
jgi:formamidopyrimidine-DNA glycosylase